MDRLKLVVLLSILQVLLGTGKKIEIQLQQLITNGV